MRTGLEDGTEVKARLASADPGAPRSPWSTNDAMAVPSDVGTGSMPNYRGNLFDQGSYPFGSAPSYSGRSAPSYSAPSPSRSAPSYSGHSFNGGSGSAPHSGGSGGGSHGGANCFSL